MRIRSFEDGDIRTSGRQFASGRDAVARGIYHRLRLFLGEYFLDVSDGTAWFQSVLGKVPQDVAEITLKERIVSAPGVARILDFQFTPDLTQRRITVSARILTTDGETADVLLDEDLI